MDQKRDAWRRTDRAREKLSSRVVEQKVGEKNAKYDKMKAN